MDYAAVASHIVEHGGITINLHGDMPQSGYAVAMYPDCETVVHRYAFNSHALRMFVETYAHILESDTHAYVGAWIDGDSVYLDISAVLRNRRDAIVAGIAHSQRAIYDIADQRDIVLG